MALANADAAAILDFLSAARCMPQGVAYPPELIARLGALVSDPGGHVVYRENDLVERKTPRMIDADGDWVDDADEHYWAVGPDPLTVYRSRTGDLTSARLSDVISWRQYRETAIYREYFLPGGVDHMLDLALRVGRGRQRSILLCRERGEGDFSERDREVLEALRPHLLAREARAELHRRIDATVDARTNGDPPHPWGPLTPREREIVHLVGLGRTNAQIAAELWVTPATVKKHLENVYEKLGVGNRAAAASILGSGRGAG